MTWASVVLVGGLAVGVSTCSPPVSAVSREYVVGRVKAAVHGGVFLLTTEVGERLCEADVVCPAVTTGLRVLITGPLEAGGKCFITPFSGSWPPCAAVCHG